jgi:hypothetical protein
MEIDNFFYKLFRVDKSSQPTAFIGSAFPVAPGGGLLTCRHVVDVRIPEGYAIAVFDRSVSAFAVIAHPPVLPPDPNIDMAFLPDAFGRSKTEFFPILSPQELKIGEDVYSFGFFSIGGGMADIEQGYFGGKIINFFRHEHAVDQASFMLPFPVLEGMSGSPVLTYHNGPKLVGLAIGNRSSRILASEILEYKDDKTEFKETVNRIVEFGVAYHPAAIIQFLTLAGVAGFVVSQERVAVPGLE